MKAVAGCEMVINAAGIYRWWVPDKAVYTQVNNGGARNVAEVCAELDIPHLIHISTAMAYGYPAEKPFSEKSAVGPFAADYTRTKADGDAAVLETHAKSNSSFRLDILYLGCVTGTGDTFSVGRPAAVYRDFMLGKIPVLVGPSTKYIYVAVQDVCTAISTVCERGASDESSTRGRAEKYLIANSDEMMSTRQYFEVMEKHCGVQVPSMSMNLTLGLVLGWLLTLIATYITGVEPLMPLDIMRTAYWGGIEYDCSKSKSELGLQYTSIDVAVGESIADVKMRIGIGDGATGGKPKQQ
jgi:nucleoside-diphosphate-sugar epimerase